jgi:hypothetical protein
MEVATVYLGDRLGLYRALAEGGPATSSELAQRSGTHERYAREWLEQQAVVGILEVEEPEVDPSARRYSLPAGHAEVMLDQDSLNYLAPVARFTTGLMRPLPTLVEAFRTGEGIPYPDYGADAREGQADANRVQFVNLLGSEWLPSVPDVHERLLADPPARVADIGCGAGWSSIAIARAYPNVRVAGSFHAPGDDTERLMYGWSVLFCLPTGLADEPSVGTGTVMRQQTLRRYATEAGYADVEILPIENDLWRFYRLHP